MAWHDASVTLLQILVVLAVVAAVAVVAAGVWRSDPMDGHDGSAEAGLPEPTTTVPPLRLPDGRVAAEALDGLRFSVGLRGYRMDEVDQVLDRLSDELRLRDAELAQLRGRVQSTSSGARAERADDAADADDAATGADDDDVDDDLDVASTEGSRAGFVGLDHPAEGRGSVRDAREP
jgi:DivIVA domain-containing protein